MLAKLNKRHRENFRKERKFLIKVYKFFLSTEFEARIKKTGRKKGENFILIFQEEKQKILVCIDGEKLLCVVSTRHSENKHTADKSFMNKLRLV